jgi:starvation-inducible DNA-binding protein
VVYAGIITAHRGAIETTGELDLVTQDMLIGQARQLEEFDWFVRAHLEAPDGSLTTGDARTEQAAARRAAKKR